MVSLGLAFLSQNAGTTGDLESCGVMIGLRVAENDEEPDLNFSQHGQEGYYWEASGYGAGQDHGSLTSRKNEGLGAASEKNIMTKVEAIIQNSKLEAVKSALQDIGVEGMTVMEVRGHGRQKGHTEVYRGREYSVDLIPKTKLELVLADPMVDKAVQAILGAARTGKIGDGKIFLSHIDDAIRIRNEERGEGSL